jgi:class 3 adenylate cyclase/tetratricopeptide (TPR) repeat protein
MASVTCPSCGRENPEGFAFCGYCRAPLAAGAAPREVRKTVTIVFSDVTGSTALGERLDPESLRRVMSRYFDEMRTVLERHGGTVEKFIGDAVMAVFGIPVLHEDDALRAVRAASEMRDALAALNEELERDRGVTIATRTGVNTGEVVAGDPAAGQTLVTGDAVNTAARLEQAAAPGEVLIGDSTFRLVRDAVVVEAEAPLELKGKARPVPAHRLLEVVAAAAGHARRLDSPMVGRDRELAHIREAYERVVSGGDCHLFTLLGSAGVGKSRLVEEFLEGVPAGATVLRGRCLPYGDGITFFPVADVVRQAALIAGPDGDAGARVASLVEDAARAPMVVEGLAGLLGVGGQPAPPEEIFWAVRTLFEGIAHRNPLVVVFDDIHWGEPTFLDLLDHIADWSRDAPILLVCVARPELLDLRPGWGGGKMNASSVLLEPLSEADAGRLIGNLLGSAGLPDAVRHRITEAAEGNPLFVEEMLAMLIDEGLLVEEGGGWVPRSDLSSVAVPPTIQALLAARLDRLEEAQRGVIERASVVGKEFWRGAVVELSPEHDRSGVAGNLMTLVRKELIRPGRSSFAGDDAFRFRHLLIRDAAYESMSKDSRADLHERFAGWLEGVAGDRATEFEEILGYHLEQAFRYREELGPVDDAGRALAARAGASLASAGARALGRADMPAAANLLNRAAGLLPQGSVDRARVLPDLAEAVTELGELSRAGLLLDEAVAQAEALAETALAWRARILRAFLDLQVNPAVQQGSVEGLLDRAIEELEALGDHAGLVLAWHRRGLMRFWLGHSEEALEAMDRAVGHAIHVGDRRLVQQSQFLYFGPLMWGPIPIPEAEARADALIASGASLQTEALLLGLKGYFAALVGHPEEAVELAEASLARLRDIGQAVQLPAAQAMVAGETYKLCGDTGTGYRLQVEGTTALEAMGETGFLSTASAYTAGTAVDLGRLAEAERYIELSRRSASDDDFSSQELRRRAEARLLLGRGRHEEAEALAREAVAIVRETDYTVEHADSLSDLAGIVAASGRPGEAAGLMRQAISMYARKGATVLVERAEARLARFEALAGEAHADPAPSMPD